MKSDKHHIDDFFRDNLSDFAKEPARYSWKRISARLLWNEIAHFRFGNVPKLWYGITATGIVGLSILFTIVLNDGSTEIRTGTEIRPEIVTNNAAEQQKSELSEDKVVETELETASDGLIALQPEMQEISENVSETQIVTEPGKQPTKTVENIGPDNLIAEKPVAKTSAEKAIAENSIEGSLPQTHAAEKSDLPTTNLQTDTQVAETAAEKTIDQPVSKTDPEHVAAPETAITSDKQPLSEMISAISEPSTAGNTGEAMIEPQSSQAKTESIEEPVALDFTTELSTAEPEVIQETEGGSTALIFTKPLLLPMKPGFVEIDNDAHGGENAIVARSQTSLQRSVTLSSGKVQKHSARNSVLSSIFRGEYKPPKRSFQDPILAMYGGPKPYYTISAYFSPEVTEYQRIASESRENSYYGGLALSYNTSRYIIQSGIEYSSFSDLGDYMVNMSTYDSVGFYHDVVGFELDPNNPDSIIFETHTVTVWDSVQHHSHQQTNNRYTYLQIPLMVGYKAMDRGLFSAHIKAGPSFSFLLNRKEPTLDFNMPGATINGIDNYTAPRINTNIQLLVSVALHFQFTEKFGMLVEPTYRYYLNPVYDINSETLSNPFGISVKSGLFYNF